MNYREFRDHNNEWQRDRLAKRYANNPDTIKCGICGRRYIKVCSHAWQVHGINEREYKKRFGFDVGRGLVPKEYREHKAKLVYENGTINNLKKGEKYRFKKGQKGIGKYERSPQTMERLRKQLHK